MQWIGKAVGGLIGMVAGGPVGAVVGVVIGHQIDANIAPNSVRRASGGARVGGGATSEQVGDRFFRTTFHVMGHVAKSDGRVSEQEIQAARAVMSELRLTPDQIQTAIACYTEGKSAQFAVNSALSGLYSVCGGRPDLMRAFVEIQMRAALMGNDLQPIARHVLQNIATRLGLGNVEFAHIEAVLRIRRKAYSGGATGSVGADEESQLMQAYKVLECTPQNSNEELSLAYRRQLSRHHPDKLKANGLPDSMIEHAKQRTQQIIEAWDLVRARRGI